MLMTLPPQLLTLFLPLLFTSSWYELFILNSNKVNKNCHLLDVLNPFKVLTVGLCYILLKKKILTILHGLTSKFSIIAQCDKQKFYFLNFSKFSHPMILVFSSIRSPEHILQDCVNRICGHFFFILNFIQGYCAQFVLKRSQH